MAKNSTWCLGALVAKSPLCLRAFVAKPHHNKKQKQVIVYFFEFIPLQIYTPRNQFWYIQVKIFFTFFHPQFTTNSNLSHAAQTTANQTTNTVIKTSHRTRNGHNKQGQKHIRILGHFEQQRTIPARNPSRKTTGAEERATRTIQATPDIGKSITATRRRTRLADSAQHVSIIQHPKTPRSKNVQTGALEGRSGRLTVRMGMLGYAQLLFTRTRTHTETAPQNQNFTPYALARTASGRTVCHPERSEGSGRTVPFPDERALWRMNGLVGQMKGQLGG